jgi:phytoene desaturase
VSKRVVIIGAGPGGLAATMLLASRGLEVTVIERRSRVGGRTSTFEAEGFRFDLGPTFFMLPRVLEAIFEATGRDLHAEVPLVRLNPHYRICFGAGGTMVATPDVDRLERAVAGIAPEDADSVRAFLDDNRRKFERFQPFFAAPCASWLALLHPRFLSALPLVRPHLSLDQDLRRFFSDPRIRLAFSFQSKYLGMSPFRCPSLFTILSFMEYEYGVFHPLGGCGAVTEVMARAARDLGATIRLGEPVEAVLFEGRRAVGVRTAENTYSADAVVINADFGRAMTQLVPDRLRRRWSDRAIEKKRFSCSAFMVYLGIEGRYDDIAHHTIYIAEDYVKNLEDIERRFVLSEDPSFYLQNACVTDPDLAPPGMSTLYVLVPVPHRHPHIDWDRERDRYRSLALRHLARVGVDDVEGRIRYERILTPVDWDERYEIYRGAVFNLAHNLGQMLHRRPHNRFEDLESVYLVGGGTHPGSGLPTIFLSAIISSRLLLEDLGLPSIVPPDFLSAGPRGPVERREKGH